MNAGAVYQLGIQACERLKGRIVETPLVRHAELDRIIGSATAVKAEVLQWGGSFKFRGACNAIRALDANRRSRGVVAFSSGNHAVAVATAAALEGVSAIVIMPDDAPRIKADLARAAGATVVCYSRETDDREAISQAYVDKGFALIPPFDHYDVIAGAATGAIEAARQWMASTPQPPEAVVLPCSGGGLAAGWGVVMRRLFPDIEIYLAEPTGFDDARISLSHGQRRSNPLRTGSICDALLAPTLGELTFPLLQEVDAKGIAVSDEEVFGAMRWSMANLKMVVEPGGAAALAAALSRQPPLQGKRTLLVLSGGNVDPALLVCALNDDWSTSNE